MVGNLYNNFFVYFNLCSLKIVMNDLNFEENKLLLELLKNK